MAVLRVKAGDSRGEIYEMSSDNLVIGRDREGAVQILDKGVSRKHAEIFRIGELYFIRDLKSRNGTYVNSEKISEAVLRFGDQIQIGTTVLVFEDRLARFRDSQEILVGDRELKDLKPSSTLQIHASETIERHVARRAAETPESRRLSAMVGISHIIGSETNLSKILAQAAAQIGNVVNAENVFIFSIEGEKSEAPDLTLLARYDRSEELQNEGVSRGIIRGCLDQGQAVLTSDAGLDARFDSMASVVLEGIKSVICVPITGLGRNIGVLYLSNSHMAEAFKAEDLELASAVSIQLGITIQLLHLIHRSEEFFRDSIRSLVAAVESRDPFHKGRAERLAGICLAVSKELNWNTHDCRNAWIAGMLFDIGSIPLSDRDREGKITLDTRKNHYATQLLQEAPALQEVLPAIVQQKERWDGSGSPEGLQEGAIHPLAQILGLAYEFDELSASHNVPVKEALMKIQDMAEKQFRAELVDALLIAYRKGTLFSQESGFFEIPF